MLTEYIHPLEPFLGLQVDDPFAIVNTIKLKCLGKSIVSISTEVLNLMSPSDDYTRDNLNEAIYILKRLKPKNISLFLRFQSIFSRKKNLLRLEYKAFNEELGSSWMSLRSDLIKALIQKRHALPIFEFGRDQHANHPLHYEVDPSTSLEHNLNTYQENIRRYTLAVHDLQNLRKLTLSITTDDEVINYSKLGCQFGRYQNLKNLIWEIGLQIKKTDPRRDLESVGADLILPELEKMVVLNLNDPKFIFALISLSAKERGEVHEVYYPPILKALLSALSDPYVVLTQLK